MQPWQQSLDEADTSCQQQIEHVKNNFRAGSEDRPITSFHFGQLCQIIRAGTKVKILAFKTYDTEKGPYTIVWKRKECRNFLHRADSGKTSRK